MSLICSDYSLSCLLVVTENDNDKYLSRSLNSIGIEQSQRADQYVIVRNGPLNDGLRVILKRFAEHDAHNVLFVDLPKLTNLSIALNAGLSQCTGTYTARMDPDDVSHPDRFSKQMRFLAQSPNVDICGAWIGEFQFDVESVKIRKLPISHADIVEYAKLRNPIAHPSVIFKTQSISDIGGYADVDKAQDYLLWCNAITQGYKLSNIPETLLYFRSDINHMQRRGWQYFKGELVILKKMRSIGFLSRSQFLKSCLLRLIVRMQFVWLRRLIYKLRS